MRKTTLVYLARALARRAGVTLQAGRGWCVDLATDTIYYPASQTMFTDADVALILHETAHINYTDLRAGDFVQENASKYGLSAKRLHNLLNAAEDGRVEYRLSCNIPVQEYFDAHNLPAIERIIGQLTSGADKLPLHVQIGATIDAATMGGEYARRVAAVCSPTVRPRLESLLNDWDLRDAIQGRSSTCRLLDWLIENVITRFKDVYELQDGETNESEQGEQGADGQDGQDGADGEQGKSGQPTGGKGGKQPKAGKLTDEQINELRQKLNDLNWEKKQPRRYATKDAGGRGDEPKQIKDDASGFYTMGAKYEKDSEQDAGRLAELIAPYSGALARAVSIIKDRETARTRAAESGVLNRRKLPKLAIGTAERAVFLRDTNTNDNKKMTFHVVVDNSGSMDEQGKARGAQMAAAMFARVAYRAGRAVKLYRFGDWTREIPAGNERAALESLAALGFVGGTDITLALRTVEKNLTAESNAVIILTDGEDGNDNVQAAIESLTRKTNLHAIGIGTSQTADTFGQYGRDIAAVDELPAAILSIIRDYAGKR